MKTVIFGAGGTAKNILEILISQRENFIGYVSTEPKGTVIKGYKVLSGLDEFLLRWQEMKVEAGVIAIGHNFVRKRIFEQLKHVSIDFPSVIHTSTILSNSATIGCGNLFMAASIVQSDANVGNHCLINTQASIDHDCDLGNYSSIGPGATLCGTVTIGECAAIGAKAVVLEKRKVGAHCVVGAGAVVIEDLPDYSVAAGVPAKIINYRNQNDPYIR